MALTPEGRVKRRVSAFLGTMPGLYYYMPVQAGYGRATLDYVGCYLGRFFAIETKAPGKHATDRQRAVMKAMTEAGAAVFVIDSDDLSELKRWMTEIKESVSEAHAAEHQA